MNAPPEAAPRAALALNGLQAALALLLVQPSPARAQESVAPPTPEKAAAAGPQAQTEDLRLPGYGESAERWSLELGLAPQLVSHNPLRRGTQTSKALDLTATLSTVQPLSSALEAEFDAGAVKTIAHGSTSTLAAAAELRTRPDAAGLSLFGNYTLARDYDGFFDHGEATTHTVTSGLRFGRALGATQIGFELAPRWKHSSIKADDHAAINLQGELVAPVIGDRVQLVLDSSVERRWYGNRDPIALIQHRDWRFATYLGVDLAGAFDLRRPWLRDLSLGVEWLKVDSNLADHDRSDLTALPAISMGIAF